jgi:hypothetical protein
VQFLEHRLAQAAAKLDRVGLGGDQSGESACARDGAR